MLVHGIINAKLGTKHVIHKKLPNVSILTGLKVPSLTYECLFYRPKHNSKGGTHEIEF